MFYVWGRVKAEIGLPQLGGLRAALGVAISSGGLDFGDDALPEFLAGALHFVVELEAMHQGLHREYERRFKQR
jgi:hypothetical protein